MGMGGGGSVNGMVYTRGASLDYDEWPEGWRWSDLLSDFEAIDESSLRIDPDSGQARQNKVLNAASYTEGAVAPGEIISLTRSP